MAEPHYIDPTQAAHNIAAAFCAHEVQKLPESSFVPGESDAVSDIRNIWHLYSNVYDSVFEMAVSENTLSADEE